MSTDHGDDDGGDSLALWFYLPIALTAVIVAIFVAAIIVLWILWKVVKTPYIWWRDRRAKFRQPVDDGHELLERQESVEGPRKSEESTGTIYESEKPVENNAKLEV